MLYNTERPQSFDSFVGQKYIVESIRAQVKRQQFFGVYLFVGHFGCGKTSMERVLSLAMNCEHPDENGNPCLECVHCKAILKGSPDIREMDAATHTGVDAIRELRESVSFRPMELRRKVYVIDEVHMLSKGAFNALLKVLEEPPEYCTFILCTTEMNAIPATIRSRSACYYFEELTQEELRDHVTLVANKNQISLLPGTAEVIAKYSQGAARNALSILDQVSTMEEEISPGTVQRLLGASDPMELFSFISELLSSDTVKAVSHVDKFEGEGKDYSVLCDDLIEIVTDMVLYSIGGAATLVNTPEYVSSVAKQCETSSSDVLCGLADALNNLKHELRTSSGKSTVLAMVIRLTTDANNSVVALSQRISLLEREILELRKNGFPAATAVKSLNEAEAVKENLTVEADLSAEKENSDTSGFVEDSAPEHEELMYSADEQDAPFEEDVPYEFLESMYSNLNAPTESIEDVSDKKDESQPVPSEESKEVQTEVPFNTAPAESVSEEEAPATEEVVIQYMDSFDIYGLYDDLDEEYEDSISQEKPVAQTTSSENPEVIPEFVKESRKLVEKIALENPTFMTALKGCTLKECSDGCYIGCEIPEVISIINSYLSAYSRSGYDVTGIHFE